MELVRVQQGTPTTLQKQWYEDGVAVDPGTVTVGVVAADGTVVVAPSTGTGGSGTGARTFNLTTAHTALLDNLTVTWTSSGKGTLTTRVEVVGGFLFSLADARAVAPLDSVTKFPTDKIKAMRTLVEQAFEDACGVAFVQRYALERVTGDTLPRWPKVTAVRSLTVDGVATTGTVITGGGFPVYPAPYTNLQTVMLGYEHGHAYPPARVARAALFEARYRLIQANSPTDDRAVRLDTDVGSYALQQPGRGGAMMYLPESDAVIQEYSMRALVA